MAFAQKLPISQDRHQCDFCSTTIFKTHTCMHSSIPQHYLPISHPKHQTLITGYRLESFPQSFVTQNPAMYASSFVLILIAALSAGALALPSTMAPTLLAREVPGDLALSSTTAPTLHTREFLAPRGEQYIGTVAGYSNKDCTSDPVAGATTEDGITVLPKPIYDGSKDHCLTFNTPAKFLGITFGNFSHASFFDDLHCNNNEILRVFGRHKNFPSVDICSMDDPKKAPISQIGSFKFEYVPREIEIELPGHKGMSYTDQPFTWCNS